jgi:hypothetical protein
MLLPSLRLAASRGFLGLAPTLLAAAWAPARALSRAPAADPPLATSFPRGLTSASATDRYYTSALDLAQPLLLLRGSADFLAAARADAQERAGLRGSARLPRAAAAAADERARAHARSAAARCRDFVLSGAVHGRAELKGALEALCRGEGVLGLLLGGKSVGKSLLLSELARRTDLAGAGDRRRAVLYIDARRCGMDLCSGLAGALEEEAGEQQRSGALAGPRRTQDERKGPPEPLTSPAPLSSSLKGALKGEFWGAGVESEATLGTAALGGISSLATSAMQRNKAALERTLALVQAKGMYLCLVVDEANLALALPPLAGSQGQQAALQDTRLLLELLVALTKQSSAANVLLVSSEHAFPYHLHASSFNVSNLTHTIIAGEVPPAEMRALLRGVWGLGPRLSDVFLAYYGGHVHMAARALAALAEEGGEFNCSSVAPVLAPHQIDACLEANEAAVAPLMRQLAQRGFASVEGAEAQAAAQLLARASVAGLVDTNARVLGQPPHVRRGAKYGLVPSSHFMVRVGGGGRAWGQWARRPRESDPAHLTLSLLSHTRTFSFAIGSATCWQRHLTSGKLRGGGLGNKGNAPRRQ